MVVTLLGLPLEEEADSFERSPWLTWLTIWCCIVVSALAFHYPDYALKHFAYYNSSPFPYNVLTSITSFFIHANWFHLLFNMYFFWVFGDNVEDELGKLKFLLLLFTAAVSGDMLSGWLDPRMSDMPGVGASGGIAGLVAYYLIRFPYRRFVVMIFFHPFSVPVIYFGAFYFIKECVGAFLQIGGVSSISHLAHLGGALIGVAFAYELAPSRDGIILTR